MKIESYFRRFIIFTSLILSIFFLDMKLTGPQKKISGAFEALKFWSEQRAYPNKTIPDIGHYRSYETSQQRLKNYFLKSSKIDFWKPVGPHNIGGRTLCVAINPKNPSTIYAGSASGGLWRSFSGGLGDNCWEYVHTGFPVLGVSSIAIAEDDTNLIYIGTGEVYGYQNATGGLNIRTTRGSYGIGILKTTDGGATWEKSLDWSYQQKRGVQDIQINPKNSRTVWAATTEGTYRTFDGGKTWQRVNNTIMAMDVEINPSDTSIVFVACGDLGSSGLGIYRTTDCGESWTKLTGGLPDYFEGKPIIDIYEKSPNIIYASIGNGHSVSGGNSITWLCRSTDGGDTWEIVSVKDYARYQGWYSHFVGISPVDSNRIFCGGVYLWRSTNGGYNLRQITSGMIPAEMEDLSNFAHADFHSIAFHPSDPDIIYFGNDGGVWRTTNGGETFQSCNSGYQTAQFYNGFSSSPVDSNVAIGGMQDNNTAIYEGSLVWRRVLSGDGTWTAIHPTNPKIMYGSYQWLGTIWKSIDGGYGWNDLRPPSIGSACFIAPYIICNSNPDIIYAGRSYVLKSENSGKSWKVMGSLDGNPILSLAASSYNSDVVYAGTAPTKNRAGIFKTINGGVSWENITGDLPDRYPVDIAVDPLDDMIAYVAFSGFGTSHLFKTTNGGFTWEDVGKELPDVPTSAVIIDPKYPNNVYVGNDIGVYVSKDGGKNWINYNEGLPEAVIVMDLSISNSNRKLRIATHGNGVYERKLIEGTSNEREIASDIILYQNYPNPFNSRTTIRFYLPESCDVRLQVYNMLGQKIATLINKNLNMGMHSIVWNCKNVASGLYVYRLSAGNRIETKRLLLIR